MRSPHYNELGHGLCNRLLDLRGLLRVGVEPMKREELLDKIAGFNHGVDSHGNLLTPWRHEKDCVMCKRLADFVEGLFDDQDKASMKLLEDAFTKELNEAGKPLAPLLPHSGSIFDCPACKVR